MKTGFQWQHLGCLLTFSILTMLALPPQIHAQQHGGILKYMVPSSGAPSLDGHRETTFATIHPTAPFYSLLIQVDPTSTKARIIGDLATRWRVSEDKKTYTFTLRKGVKFHDGSPLTSRDVVASWRKLVNPETYGKEITSARKRFFSMIKSYRTKGSYRVVFTLHHPSNAFIPTLAVPFNYIYKADILKKNPRFYEKSVMGSGPFRLKKYVPRKYITGESNPSYYVRGLPYLDGFQAIFAKRQGTYVKAIQDGKIHGIFRGLPPDAVTGLLKKKNAFNVHEGAWNCLILVAFNTDKKPFDDVRVRRALHLAIDRWGGSKALSQTTIVKTVGGYTFPGHPLSFTQKELRREPGYGNFPRSLHTAKLLLKRAKQTDLSFELLNRDTDQPYLVVGNWLVEQWKKIGVNARQKVVSTPQWYAQRRNRQHAVAVDAGCQALVNPTVDIAKFIPGAPGDYTSTKQDKQFNRWYAQQLRESNFKKQRKVILKMQRYALRKMWAAPVLWWNLVLVHDRRLEGYVMAQSHFLNMRHAHLWLNQ